VSFISSEREWACEVLLRTEQRCCAHLDYGMGDLCVMYLTLSPRS
jgi:hypothetical protein